MSRSIDDYEFNLSNPNFLSVERNIPQPSMARKTELHKMHEAARTEWSGLRDKEINFGKDHPSGGFTSSFRITPVRRLPYEVIRGTQLAWTRGRRPHQVVVPSDYSGLKVERHRPRESGGGFARWKVRAIQPKSLQKLTRECAGRHNTVLLYDGGASWAFYTFEEDSLRSGEILFNPLTGGDEQELSRAGR